MTSHRAEPAAKASFQWKKAVPDTLTLVAMLDGLIFGIAIMLFLLINVFPNLFGEAVLALGAWVVASIAFVWMKESDGRR